MKSHWFTLELHCVNEEDPRLEDALFEAGCHDALITWDNGIVLMEFDRQAENREAALNSAIKDIEKLKLDGIISHVTCFKYLQPEIDLTR